MTDGYGVERHAISIRPDRRARLVYAAGGRFGLILTAVVLASVGLLSIVALVQERSGSPGFGFVVVAYWLVVLSWRYLDSRTFVLIVDAGGVEDRFGHHVHRWEWEQVALLAWDSGYRAPRMRSWFGPTVAVCVYGKVEPSPTFGGIACNRAAVVAALRELSAAGWTADPRPWSASTWWDLDPRSNARRTDRDK